MRMRILLMFNMDVNDLIIIQNKETQWNIN